MQIRNKVRKSLRVSFIDGLFSSSMTGMTGDYITPYALALKATERQIGFLGALPSLVSSLVQLHSPDITEKLKSRKIMMNIFVLLHALMGIPIILAPYIFKIHPVVFLIVFVTLFNAFQALAVPAWSSLMSEYIPYKKRGEYFGWRNKILGAVSVGAAFVAGMILNFFKNNILKGFLIIFSTAFICRIISWIFLTQMYEPPFRRKKEAYFTFYEFIRRIRESNFAKFVFFVAALTFCVNLASPFFSVLMLRDLKFNYIIYTILVVSVPIAQILTFGRWGRHADHIGNVKVLRLTSLFIASLPLWWVINRHPVYLVFAQSLSGFAWAGFNLCATNFIYDAVSPEKRTRCIAYFNVCTGVAVCLGSLAGGFLLKILPRLMGYNILSLFVLSSTLRFFTACLFYGKIKEVRAAGEISSKDLFCSVIGLRPVLGAIQDSRENFKN